ncbi:sugar-binding domain-containing protein [Bacteroides cellulosilyticus]|uniref:sugar-binding domain-containing protein n=1 Tax=Bacteroides cellulosilyticus TaxID=246787 RepID=UPI0018A913FC|nr:sugar-binding domain-containing protein [Bacteroides cellulosilyticus]
MKKRLLITVLLVWGLAAHGQIIDLSGKWSFETDSEDRGITEQWQYRSLKDSIALPGAMHIQGKGNEVTADTKWYSGALSAIWYTHPMYAKYREKGNVKIFDFLQPDSYYVGPAWYSREIMVPGDFKNKHIVLVLERVHWESILFINGKKVGNNLGLGTKHEYDVTDYLLPGKNNITLRINNAKVIDTGRIPHSTSDQTMAAWNGIIGEMKITARERVWIDEVQVFPQIGNRKALAKLKLGNKTGRVQKMKIKATLDCYNTSHPYSEKPLNENFTIGPDEFSEVELELPFSEKMQLWDEFSPSLYKLTLALHSGKLKDETSVSFGMREVGVQDKRITLNGDKRWIRANLYCGEAPLDGLPSVDVEWWKRILLKHKEYGHNAVRFHSWCPPKAAFVAADEIGVYLQPEVGEWGAVYTDKQERFINEEAERMIRQYGNFASFIFMAMGNESSADTLRMHRFIVKQKADGRRLVSGKMNGRPDLPEADFYATHSIEGKNMRHHVGWPPTSQNNLLFHIKPGTSYDYNEAMSQYDKPFFSHEVGQYCVFPDFEAELPKYTGSMKATVLEIQRDQLKERGMAHLAPVFTKATGEWQMRLLKAEYEAIFRTPDVAGFHSLSLQDFTGQGTAPVGVLDAFWDEKKHVKAADFRRFCDSTVVLARIPSILLTSGEKFSAGIEVCHFGAYPLKNATLIYTIKDELGNVYHEGKTRMLEIDNHSSNQFVERVVMEKSFPDKAVKYFFNVGIQGTSIFNQWEFWVFPEKVEACQKDVIVVHEMNENTIRLLKEGGKVLWLTDRSKLKGKLPLCFASIYWTSFGLNEGESMCNSIVCDPAHPLFDGFPTEMHTNWQWWDVLRYANPMVLDEFGAEVAFPKKYQPLLQVVDSWKINRKLALLAECRLGKGKLMISSIDFTTDMNERMVSRNLYAQILDYMNSKFFAPEFELTENVMLSVLGGTENNLVEMGAKIKGQNRKQTLLAQMLVDGDGTTVCNIVSDKKAPQWVSVNFSKAEQLKGFRFVFPGRVTEKVQLRVDISSDGRNWQPVTVNSSIVNGKIQNIFFDANKTARYFKLSFLSDSIAIGEMEAILTDMLPVEG